MSLFIMTSRYEHLPGTGRRQGLVAKNSQLSRMGDAMRILKRHPSNLIYSTMLRDTRHGVCVAVEYFHGGRG
jgi:hypothetical protein